MMLIKIGRSNVHEKSCPCNYKSTD